MKKINIIGRDYSNCCRKIARSVAKNKAKKAGVNRMFKHNNGTSWFSQNWRDLVNYRKLTYISEGVE